MSVTITWVWTCDHCGARAEVTRETSAWSDPVVTPPDGWQSPDEGADICPDCARTR